MYMIRHETVQLDASSLNLWIRKSAGISVMNELHSPPQGLRYGPCKKPTTWSQLPWLLWLEHPIGIVAASSLWTRGQSDPVMPKYTKPERLRMSNWSRKWRRRTQRWHWRNELLKGFRPQLQRWWILNVSPRIDHRRWGMGDPLERQRIPATFRKCTGWWCVDWFFVRPSSYFLRLPAFYSLPPSQQWYPFQRTRK